MIDARVLMAKVAISPDAMAVSSASVASIIITALTCVFIYQKLKTNNVYMFH